MHHKRKRPKNRRSGCLMCKPHKMNGLKGSFKAKIRKEQKAIISEEEQRDEILRDGGISWITCWKLLKIETVEIRR